MKVVQLIAILLFFQGFFLTKKDITTISTEQDLSFEARIGDTIQDPRPLFNYDTVFLFIIDGLRLDFLLQFPGNFTCGHPLPYNCLSFLHHLLIANTSQTQFYGLKVDPPTVTAPRLKALTTGSPPTFLSALYNLNSSKIQEDNFIQQLTDAKTYRMTVMGDNTWQALFPEGFDEYLVFDSFNTRDLDTVDEGIRKELERMNERLFKEESEEGKEKQKRFIVCHFLGVDHIGHSYNAFHPLMAERLKLMNELLISLINNERLGRSLFLVMGDHGMTDEGEHGGSTYEETMSGLFLYSSIPFASPSFEGNDSTLTYFNSSSNRLIKVLAKEILSVPRTITQIDIVSLLSVVLNVPAPFTSLGIIPPELLGGLNPDLFLQVMSSNANQVWKCLNSYFKKNYQLNFTFDNNNNTENYEKAVLDSLSLQLQEIDDKIHHQERDQLFLLLWKHYQHAVAQHLQILSLRILHKEETVDGNADYAIETALLYHTFLQISQKELRNRWTEYNLSYLNIALAMAIFCLILESIPLLKSFPFSTQKIILSSGSSPSSSWIFIGLFLFHSIGCSGSNSFFLKEKEIVFYAVQTMMLLGIYSTMNGQLFSKGKSLSLGMIIPGLLLPIANQWLFQASENYSNSLKSSIAKDDSSQFIALAATALMTIMHGVIVNDYFQQSDAMSVEEGLVYYFNQSLQLYWYYQREISLQSAAKLGIAVLVINIVSIVSIFFVRKWGRQENHSSLLSPALYLHVVMLVGIFLKFQQFGLLISALTVHWIALNMMIPFFRNNYDAPSSETISLLPPTPPPPPPLLLSSRYSLEFLMVIYFLFWERYLYFLTLHGMTFNSLQLSSAFSLMEEFSVVVGGISLFVNTFGSIWIVLIQLWMIESQEKRRIMNGGGCCWLEGDSWMKRFVFLRFFSLVMSLICLYYLRHHLMLWDIFAPKVIFEIAIFVVTSVFEGIFRIILG